MEFEEFLRHICEYVDRQIQKEMSEAEDFFDRELSELEKEFEELEEIIIPLAVLDELQAQASKGREPGFIGLDELKKIRKIFF